MLSQIGFIYLFCSPYYHKEDIFFSSLVYQGHTNQQLSSLPDSCITQWFELFYNVSLILYREHLQYFAEDKGM